MSKDINNIWCFTEALNNCIKKETSFNELVFSAMFVALQLQLEGRWKYAANSYREEHPNELPYEKFYRNKQYTNLLPREVAEQKMSIWIPWAIKQIKDGFDSLATNFQILSKDENENVDNEPTEDVLDDLVIYVDT